jgi:Fic family protein
MVRRRLSRRLASRTRNSRRSTFLDGNGRIGRLLISLVLVTERLLTRPFFYLSLYFKENRADYYDALQRVRTHGDWEGWLQFYLVGVAAIAGRAAQTTLLLRNLFELDHQRILAHGKAMKSSLTVYDLFRRRIVVSPSRGAEETGLTWPTVRNAIRNLEELGIVRETTGRKWGRLYVYSEQLRLLNEGA